MAELTGRDNDDDDDANGDVKSAIDVLIDCVPFEMHLPGYQFLGPGTHLTERLNRGERGVNPLDAACLEHDKAYAGKKTHGNRTKADRVLAERAFSRMLSETASGDEKTAALITVCCMVGKITFERCVGRLKRLIKGRCGRCKKHSTSE